MINSKITENYASLIYMTWLRLIIKKKDKLYRLTLIDESSMR